MFAVRPFFVVFFVSFVLVSCSSKSFNGLLAGTIPQSDSGALDNSEQSTAITEAQDSVQEVAESNGDATSSAAVAMQDVPADAIRFRLWDGSVAIGRLANPILHMQTDFGRLEIPVTKIVQFQPGLQSYPQVKQKIDLLVEQLGDREFEAREKAHRNLASMGVMISRLISSYSDGGSAERKKHLTELKEEIEQLMEESAEFGLAEQERPLIELDSVNTGEFTVLGTIEEKEFIVETRYGSLKIGLEDVRMADRSWMNRSPAIRKVVNIKGTQFMQTSPVSTGIRVQRGDKVSIRADGVVNWANWGNVSSTPDGIGNQGQWNGHQCGRLIARVGKNGPIFDVGSRGEFVVKSSGTLYLGIAMQDAYAQNEGYSFVGQYRARITVQPSQ